MGMDYQGRVLSQMNYYVTLEDRTLITELPITGVRTLYARWGEGMPTFGKLASLGWFAYACAILLTVLFALAIRKTVKGSVGA
jgi:hypothetical protein